jgi:hypothetical protein
MADSPLRFSQCQVNPRRLSRQYSSPGDAERAGYEAIAAKGLPTQDIEKARRAGSGLEFSSSPDSEIDARLPTAGRPATEVEGTARARAADWMQWVVIPNPITLRAQAQEKRCSGQHPTGRNAPVRRISSGRTNLQPAGVPKKGGAQPPRWTRDQVVNVEERSPAQLDMLAAATCARRRLRQRR